MDNTMDNTVSPTISLPLINSIPSHLAPRFEPTYVEYYNKYSAGRLATHQVPIESYRANPAQYTISYGRALVPQGALTITQQQCPVSSPPGNITVQIFEPDAKKWGEGKKPVLAPEEKFPTQVEDCWEALNWIHTHKASEFNLDVSRIAIGGCSAGGHLAAILAHLCRDTSLPLKFQLLSVPVVDLSIFSPSSGSLLPTNPYPSYDEFALCPPLPLERMSYFFKHFLGSKTQNQNQIEGFDSKFGKGGEEEWKVSPIKAKNWKGLADALVVTAECDVLRDEGEAYAKLLEKGGNKVRVERVKGAPHVFMQLDGILEAGRVYNRAVVEALREALR
ncbi:hypothetical protein EG329_006638 [Mollisiaceae sp. DMI_Dod_QoI]|nr:hypothetical protein EG329_006638 [Helotiales sp. DMI_Dod_QoI]